MLISLCQRYTTARFYGYIPLPALYSSYARVTVETRVQSNLYISILYICITSLLALSMPARIWDYG